MECFAGTSIGGSPGKFTITAACRATEGGGLERGLRDLPLSTPHRAISPVLFLLSVPSNRRLDGENRHRRSPELRYPGRQTMDNFGTLYWGLCGSFIGSCGHSVPFPEEFPPYKFAGAEVRLSTGRAVQNPTKATRQNVKSLHCQPPLCVRR